MGLQVLHVISTLFPHLARGMKYCVAQEEAAIDDVSSTAATCGTVSSQADFPGGGRLGNAAFIRELRRHG
jgi:hypothetical protein